MKKHILSVIALLSAPLLSFSQLTVTNNSVANTLAQDIVGPGVTISNAAINCGNQASGTFTYTGTNLGIPNGILLTTGHAQDAANPGSYFCNVVNGNNFTDPNITAISSQAIYDVCILQFDFAPICDSIRITYVFGSEEYPQYIYQTYNDVFAIFLTGPNPAGGNYVGKNIATLPNGTTPVSIDSVNGGWPIGTNAAHPAYYHNNYTSPNNDIAYNGYTIPVTSSAALVPCSSYHMKIAIADGGNGHNDSGVFIKGNSVACQNTPIVAAANIPTCSSNGTVVATVSNYTGTPTYSWSPGGQTTDTLKNVPPGTYTCVVAIPGLCSNYTVTAVVQPQNPAPISVNSPSLCSGSSATITASGANTYTWSPATGLSSASSGTVTANPVVTTTYTVTGTDLSGCVKTATCLVSVNPSPSATATVNSPVCTSKTVSLSVSPVNNATYSWTGPGGFSSSNQNPNITNAGTSNNGVYVVTVNVGGCSSSYSVLVNVSAPPAISAISQTICKGSSTNLSATGASSYTWSPSSGLSNSNTSSPTASPSVTTTYTITGTTTSGCTGTGVVTVSVSSVTGGISANPTTGNPPLSVTFTNNTSGTGSYWDFGNGTTSATSNSTTSAVYQNPGTYTVIMISSNAMGCKDTSSVVIIVDAEASISIPNVFTPNGDGINDVFFIKSTGLNMLQVDIYDRWGLLMWESTSITGAWDGKHGSKEVPDGTYFYIVSATSKAGTKSYKGPLLLAR